MAEAVIVSIAGDIFAKLLAQALDKVGNLWGVKHEIEELRKTVSTLQAVLDDAEEQCYQSCQIQDWVQKLKDAFYDMQDVIEEFSIEAIRRELRGHNEISKQVKTFFSRSNQLAFKLKMGKKSRAMRERIEAIKADRGLQLDKRPEREQRKREETHSFISDENIKGRDEDKKKVMKFLLDSNVEEDVSVLPIVGIGGLGKTALAQYVYNDEMVSKQFDLKMWVYVSNEFDMNKIVKNILACAKKRVAKDVSMEHLQSELRAKIDGKRYILVLDDLWNAEKATWLSLKNLLMGGSRGSKILITTRIPKVAEITSTTLPHCLGGLSESASLDLLMQMACRKEEETKDHNMLAIGKEIVRKCSGVPLVVRTVGSLLFFKKTKLEWLHFKDHELLEVSQMEDCIKSVLRLSYDHLPSHLKQCFAFCSLFPKGYTIKKQTLVNLWVAEGFIRPSNGTQHLEDIAHGYFMDLLWSNFFQDFQKNPLTNMETCKMHDLMHDLACLVAGTECWVAWDDTKSILERTRHISCGFTLDWIGKLPMSHLKASAPRTFISTVQEDAWQIGQPTPISEADLCQLIQSFTRLRILDLHGTVVEKVPRCICKLKHLTYLDLSRNKTLRRLPNSITRLQNLQTLNLCNCFALEELPRGMRKLVSLQDLDIDGCWELSYVPRGLGQLSSLHRLTRFILPHNKALAKSYSGLGELNRLNNIRGSLSIEHLEHVIDVVAESTGANLIEKHSLESLELRWGYLHYPDENSAKQTGDRDNNRAKQIGDRDNNLLDGLRPHLNLQKLTIDGYNGESFPKWMMKSLVDFLPNLVKVCLEQCQRCKHLPPLGQLPNLEYLEIRRLTKLEYIESESKLEYIESDHSPTSTASFPSLLILKISNCKELKRMPLTPHLKELTLRKVNPEWINQIVGLNKLKSLGISEMEFLECLPEKCLKSLTSLEILRISECPRLTSLSLHIQQLSNLVEFSLECCEELDLSKDESGNILDLHRLQSLRSVEILTLPKVASLPHWLLQLSNLERLQISNCLELKALPEQIDTLQSLQQLEIIECRSLTSLPEGMQRLASLTHLRIAGCPDLEERCKKEDWYKIAHIPNITYRYKIAHIFTRFYMNNFKLCFDS